MVKKKNDQAVFDIIVYAVLIFFTLACIIPLMRVIALAFSSQESVLTGEVTLLPVNFDLTSLKYIINQNSFRNSFFITILVTIAHLVLSMQLTVLTAYPLSKDYLKGKNVLTLIIVFTMLFNGGIIPTYLVIGKLHLLDTLWALIIPCAISSFNVIIMINFFRGIPKSLEESAKIDGASNISVLFRIILPVSMPVIATIALFYAVWRWNGWFDAIMYINKKSLYTLQVTLRSIILSMDDDFRKKLTTEIANISSPQVQSAAILVATLPIVIVYPFLQKYFVKGVMLGSIKG